MKNQPKKVINKTVNQKTGDFDLSLDFQDDKLKRITVRNYSGYNSDQMKFGSVKDFNNVIEAVKTLLKEEVK